MVATEHVIAFHAALAWTARVRAGPRRPSHRDAANGNVFEVGRITTWADVSLARGSKGAGRLAMCPSRSVQKEMLVRQQAAGRLDVSWDAPAARTYRDSPEQFAFGIGNCDPAVAG